MIDASLSSTSVTYLPEELTTFPNLIIRLVSDGKYEAVLEVEAGHPDEAKQCGVRVTEQLMKVLAISGDHFEINLGSVVAEAVQSTSQNAKVVTGPDDVVAMTVMDVAFLSDRVGLVNRRRNLKFEARALASLDRWPEYLRRGVDLNHLSVRGVTKAVRFLLCASSLEVMAFNKLGSPA